MTTVTVKGLWKSYDNHVVLENLNLTVKDREFVTIVGASGCGKTTFLRMLLGIEQPSRGQLLIDGQRSLVRTAASSFSATACFHT